jgi:hypothetical protein
VEPIGCRLFRLPVPHYSHHASVSTPRSSNRTCGFAASGSRRRLTQSPRPLHVTLSATSENKSGVTRLIAILPFRRRFLRPPSTGRVRGWRGSGLRMMPTFPPPPLSFRTAGFPQYGWKVGLSGSAFPHVAQVKPAPGMPCASRRFASTLRALRCPTLRPALCRNSGLGGALPFEESTLYPRGLRSGLGSIVPAHLRLIDLIRPTRRHIPISPLGVYTGCPRCAGAPRRPASGSVLSLYVPSRHAVLYGHGESIGCTYSVFHR